MAWCFTADCKYAFVYDQEDTKFHCPMCKITYCVRCKLNYHPGQTCSQY